MTRSTEKLIHAALRDGCREHCDALLDELRRLSAENEALRRAYWKMRNSAAGYSNFCEDNASTRRCERDYTEGEALYCAAIKQAEGENT